MPDTIITPTEIKRPLYEGRMEFTLGDLERKGHKSIEPQSPGPVVTLGQPQWWNLVHLAREKGATLPAEMSLLLHDADFYLLLLACSFRPEPGSHIEWARFTAYLQPKAGQENPIAFDMYPREIYDETRTDVKVNIAPRLEFAGFGVSPGEAITTIKFRRIEPVIIGFGALGSGPSWDFKKHKNHPLLGNKFGYLIVKKPRGVEAVRLILDIAANVVTQHGRLRARFTEKDRAHRTQVVCTD